MTHVYCSPPEQEELPASSRGPPPRAPLLSLPCPPRPLSPAPRMSVQCCHGLGSYRKPCLVLRVHSAAAAEVAVMGRAPAPGPLHLCLWLPDGCAEVGREGLLSREKSPPAEPGQKAHGSQGTRALLVAPGAASCPGHGSRQASQGQRPVRGISAPLGGAATESSSQEGAIKSLPPRALRGVRRTVRQGGRPDGWDQARHRTERRKHACLPGKSPPTTAGGRP